MCLSWGCGSGAFEAFWGREGQIFWASLSRFLCCLAVVEWHVRGHAGEERLPLPPLPKMDGIAHITFLAGTCLLLL